MKIAIIKRLIATAGITTVLATITATAAWAAPTYMSGQENCRPWPDTIVYGQPLYNYAQRGLTLSMPEGQARLTGYDSSQLYEWGQGRGYQTPSWSVSAPYAQIRKGGASCFGGGEIRGNG